MGDITLSSEEFKALSSETRTELLKLLKGRRHTLSEFSKKTGLAAPTVKQHLATLMNAGLIEKVDNGRKWKYYSLTRKGSEILEPKDSTSIFIMISASLIALGIVLYSFFGAVGLGTVQPGDSFLQDNKILVQNEGDLLDEQADKIAGIESQIEEGRALDTEQASQKTGFDVVAFYIAAITGLAIIAGYGIGKSKR